MSILDLVSENEKALIEQYINWYGPSQSATMDWYHYTDFNTIMKEWAYQKEKTLLKLLDGQLILRRPYTYTAQTEGLSLTIKDHLNDPAYESFHNWWIKMIRTAGNHIELQKPDGTPKDAWFSTWNYPANCFEAYTLACNAYQDDDVIVVFPSGKKMKMFKGMKPMKILHRFVEEFGGPEDLYDAFRTWHSMQLNQKKMDGELCLSIHPLDYMTMSDNANNWESCMRWTNKYGDVDTHGDFRAGTIECMNSPYIVEAYLHNPNHPYKLEDGWEWNSKQWRELFIVQEGIITEIKGYCFQDENLTNTVLMWLKELAAKNLDWEYEPEEVNVKSEINMTNIPEHEEDELYLSFDPTQYMYNDMGTLPVHRGRINKKILFKESMYARTESTNSRTNITSFFITIPYGGQATCMCCGRPFDGENQSSMVFCMDCDNVRVCACCGDVLDDGEGFYVEDIDDYYCENCWCDNCSTDPLTDESHLNDNMVEVKLLLGYDENQEPVVHESSMWVYDPEENWEFQNMFNGPMKDIEIGSPNGWWHNNAHCVTPNMINPGYFDRFVYAMDMYPRPKCVEDLYNDYNIYYDVDMNPLFEEDEETD